MNQKLFLVHAEYNKHQPNPTMVEAIDPETTITRCKGCGVLLLRHAAWGSDWKVDNRWLAINRDTCEQWAAWYPSQREVWLKLMEDGYG